MPGDSKPISDAALSRLTAYVEIECEGSDDEFIEGNDVRVNFADLKGLLARLRSVEMERDRYEAWNEDAERKIAFEERLADVPYKVIREKLAELAAAQAKLSEVERVLVKVTELVGLISTTTGDWQSIEQANRALDLLSPYR
jgi:hypothetical protein